MKEIYSLYIYSLYISIAAFVVSVFSLGWNFYRDVILKPRLKVKTAVTRVGSSEVGWQDFITVSGVNLGPGIIICNGIQGRPKAWSSLRIFKSTHAYFYVVHDHTNPLSDKLPKKLEVGDEINLFLPYNEEAFLGTEPYKVGIRDTFGRMHWASRKSLKNAKKQFFKDFKKKDCSPQ